jgi:Spy/CpxP family protein refolding chaperone
MSSRLWLWLLCGLFGASLAANAYLLWPSQPSHGGSGSLECAWLDGLGLSESQMARLRACCENDCCDAGAGIAAQADRVRSDLRAALAEPRVDAARIHALAAELGALQARCMTNAVDSILRVRDILEPDQIAKMLANCRIERGRAPGAGE